MLAEQFDGVTEIRPGNAVFCDLTQVTLGAATRDDLALSIIATVVSVNDRFAIIDAGSKMLSSDRGAHGSARMTGIGRAQSLIEPWHDFPVASLSEEHGLVEHGGHPLAIGQRLRIWPNHACAVANLARS